MEFFEIFKAGNYPQGAFTETDIASLVHNYDPTFCEAPLTLDHIQKGPAYGWVSELKNEEGKLKASFKEVTPELKDFVQNGKYKKVSVEIYRDLDGRKPYLKAVSFLGAAIPQVKGMKSIQFKESPSDVYMFELEDIHTLPELQTIQADLQKMNQSIQCFNEQISKIENQECKEVLEAKCQIIKLQNNVSDLNSKLSKFQDNSALRQKAEEELSKLRLQIRKNEFEQFLNEQIGYGNLTPSQKDLSLKILMTLDSIPNFEESSDPIKGFKELIKSLPKQVEYAEIATKNKQDKKENDHTEFSNASEESLAIYNEAKSLSEKENISFKEALLKLYK